jgi:phosphoribosylaminoimidazolecarboxamide formyltransferase/IMP cyclohydrolase
VDEPLAALLSETFLEVVVAPAYDTAALEILAKKKNLRLLELPEIARPAAIAGLSQLELRSIPGGLLVQQRDVALAKASSAKVVSKREPTAEELRDLELAWAVCKHVRSNAIVLAKDGVAVGVGPGQPNRLDSVRIAATRAGAHAKGAVLASDAFFPFADGLIAAVDAGATAVIEPGGSVRDDEVIRAADERGIALLFTGERHFRH